MPRSTSAETTLATAKESAAFLGRAAAVAAGAVVAGLGLALLAIALPIAFGLMIAVLAARAWVRWPVRLCRRWQARRLLSSDWWSQFERDLDSYTGPAWTGARHRERSL
jgi:hypothetical protein